ncbi:DUF4328 domain-containing protein [Streptomyces sp. NPDC047123]|uniref:DUF4328 domain-containing protein n=1 Tax=Streptomyces sp. NPDC047123 TaxID=3155622 RepID=UPI0033F94F3C
MSFAAPSQDGPPPSPSSQPPAPPSPAAPPGRPARLSSPIGLSRAVMVLLGVVMAVDLYALWAGTVVRDVMADMIGGRIGDSLQADAEHADELYAFSGSLQLGALITTCVVFLVWFHRVRVNAEVFAPAIHRKSRGWTVGGWFVPIVNLWFPRRIAVDIWDASGPREVLLARSMTLDTTSPGAPHRLLNTWWTLWVADLLASRWANQAYTRAEEPEEVKAAIEYLMFADALDIVAAVLAVLFVHRLTRLQDLKVRSGPPRPAPAPGPAAAG